MPRFARINLWRWRVGQRMAELESRIAALEAEQSAFSVSDSLYSAIEDRFRGDPELVKTRQRRYLEEIRRNAYSGGIIDLGSGRGEWLDLLREIGAPAYGVDGNASFVGLCRSRGLDVRHEDLLDHLRSLPGDSMDGITMFQVAEHLSLSVLQQVLAECHRIAVPGGVLIVEIPNAETLRVGASTFWIDPTHKRPIFPEFLVLLAERAGFGAIKRVFSTPLEENLHHHDPVVARLVHRVDGPGDFAIIAAK